MNAVKLQIFAGDFNLDEVKITAENWSKLQLYDENWRLFYPIAQFGDLEIYQNYQCSERKTIYYNEC